MDDSSEELVKAAEKLPIRLRGMLIAGFCIAACCLAAGFGESLGKAMFYLTH